MAFTHTTGEDFSGGGKFLDKEGWYHLMVSSASDTPKKPGGELINNCKFSIDCTAAAGSVEGCKDKTISLKFFEPNTSHKDKGAMACKKIDRALIAMNPPIMRFATVIFIGTPR